MRVHGSSLQCDYCKTVVVPDRDDEGVRVLGEIEGKLCPVCQAPLVQATLADIPLVYCTRCHGMLIAMQAFQTLVDTLRADLGATVIEPASDPNDLRRIISCPQCHRPMEAHFYCGPGNVVIDTCEHCLLNWLDNGELSRITHAPDEHPPSDF